MADLGDCGNQCVAVKPAGEGVMKVTPVGEGTIDILRAVPPVMEPASSGTVSFAWVG